MMIYIEKNKQKERYIKENTQRKTHMGEDIYRRKHIERGKYLIQKEEYTPHKERKILYI